MILIQNKCIVNSNLYTYFYNIIRSVNSTKRNFEINSFIQHYLSDILSSQEINSLPLKKDHGGDSLKSKNTPPEEDYSLEAYLKNVSQASLQEILSSNENRNKFRDLKRFGDSILLLNGFFYKSLSKSVLGSSYYEALGKEAYANLYYILREHRVENINEENFLTIEKKFGKITEFLNEVSDLVFLIAGILEKETLDLKKLKANYEAYQKCLAEESSSKIIIVKSF